MCHAPAFETVTYWFADSRIQVIDDAIVFDLESTADLINTEIYMKVLSKPNCGYTYQMSYSPNDKISLSQAGTRIFLTAGSNMDSQFEQTTTVTFTVTTGAGISTSVDLVVKVRQCKHFALPLPMINDLYVLHNEQKPWVLKQSDWPTP